MLVAELQAIRKLFDKVVYVTIDNTTVQRVPIHVLVQNADNHASLILTFVARSLKRTLEHR